MIRLEYRQGFRQCGAARFAHGVRGRRGRPVVGLAFSPWMWWSRPFRKRDGLRNHGWIDRRNLIIEYRYPPSLDRHPSETSNLIASEVGRVPFRSRWRRKVLEF
jgi:hypothetical protein